MACLSALGLVVTSCSTVSRVPGGLRAPPVVASLERLPPDGGARRASDAGTGAALAPGIAPDPASPPASSPEEPDAEVDLTAGMLLERGFAFFQDEKPALAAAAFRAAIATGNLNEAGRALAYWHVYLAERSQARTGEAAEALASFLAAAQEVIEGRAERPPAPGVVDFAERFGLLRRMTRARAILSAIWAEHVRSFGRSAERPVPVQSDSEVDDFLEVAPPCADAPDRQLSRRTVSDERATLERVDVRCHGRRDGAEYYFEKMAAEAS